MYRLESDVFPVFLYSNDLEYLISILKAIPDRYGSIVHTSDIYTVVYTQN